MNYEGAYARRIRALVQERREELTESLVRGACPDFAGYRYICGGLDALRQIDDIMDQVRREFGGTE